VLLLSVFLFSLTSIDRSICVRRGDSTHDTTHDDELLDSKTGSAITMDVQSTVIDHSRMFRLWRGPSTRTLDYLPSVNTGFGAGFIGPRPPLLSANELNFDPPIRLGPPKMALFAIKSFVDNNLAVSSQTTLPT
jgi:hypothetical protein